MKRRIILVIVYLAFAFIIFGETPLTRQLNWGLIPTIRYKDQSLSVHEQLDKWFPHHQKILIGYNYYLTTPYFQDIRADFYLEYHIENQKSTITADITATYTEDEIILKNSERIKASNLTEIDFLEIKSQLAWLNVVFRTLGTPIPEILYGEDDDIETWTIIYDEDKKERVILPSLKDTIKRLNSFYEGQLVYFKFNEVKKINSRIEFYGTFLIKDLVKSQTDFIDIRFHTDRWNEIDLVMLFVYRNI